jgi:hypothetical protein
MKTALILFLFFSVSGFAALDDGVRNGVEKGKGMIRVLNAPLFAEPSENARIVQYVRKGQLIPLDPKYFFDGPGDRIYERATDIFERDDETDLDRPYSSIETGAFLETIDRNGQPAWIMREHVKLIYEDTREERDSVAIEGHDPTDYRLEEPLYNQYPFPRQRPPWRSFLTLGTGSRDQATYPYPTDLTNSNYGTPFNLMWSYLRHCNDGGRERLFAGLLVSFSNASNEFNGGEILERHLALSAGPMVTWDFVRTIDWRLVSGASLGLLYRNVGVTFNNNQSNEKRTFYGLTLAPQMTLFLEKRNVMINNFSFVIGGSFELRPSQVLKTTSVVTGEGWNPESDEIANNLEIIPSLFVGIAFETF